MGPANPTVPKMWTLGVQKSWEHIGGFIDVKSIILVLTAAISTSSVTDFLGVFPRVHCAYRIITPLYENHLHSSYRGKKLSFLFV
jgi:hypothetical protein